MLNSDRVTGKDIEENEKDPLDVEGDLFCEKKIVTVLKELKIAML